MKYLITLLLTVSTMFVAGQSTEFTKIENRIRQMIHKELWDDVLLLSPDLVIEEPFKGDGYYYTAMAFMKMGDHAKADSWIAKAEAMADEELSVKIKKLKEDIVLSKKAQLLGKSAGEQSKAGNTQKAADEWQRLWEMDKSNMDYALNAVELYLERKQYESAMEILEDPLIIKDPSSKQLRDRINQTPEMKKVISFRNSLADGKKNLANGRYATAVSDFKQALSLKPGHAEAGKLKREAEDELSWKITRENNTITDFEAYLNGNTNKKYEGEAKNILRNTMFKYGRQYAEEGNIELMEKYLLQLKSTYALNTADITEANKILVETYGREAKKLSTSKSSYQLATAIDYYGRAYKIYPGTAYSLTMKSLEKKRLRYGRPDRTYLAYVYDSVNTIGLSIGGLKNRKVGVYITGRMNPEFITSSAYFTVDNSGKLDGNVYDDIRFDGEKRLGSFEGVFGFTKKVAYPLWLYAGGGVALSTEWWEMSTYNDNGTYYETEWVKNTDQSLIEPMAEAGIIIDLSGFHLRGGLKTKDFKNFKELNYSVGIGFSFK